MSNRLYFLLPDVETTEQAVAALQCDHAIGAEDIALLANENVDLGDLPEATPDESSDFIPALKRGIAIGGTGGLIAGLIAISVPVAGITLGGSAVLALAGLGAAAGGFSASLVGASVTHTKVQEFQEAIDNGRILLMVDAPTDSQAAVVGSVQRAAPSAVYQGDENDRVAELSIT